MRILHVEDDERFAQLVSDNLMQEGHVIERVANGVQAAEYIRKSEKKFDLFLFDMVLPDYSGLILLDDVKRSKHWDVPVVVITGHAFYVPSANKKGATACLTKPFTPEALSKVVREAVKEPKASQVSDYILVTRGLPAFSRYGFLPEGIHHCRLEDFKNRFVFNSHRERQWEKLLKFISWPQGASVFEEIYIAGGFVTSREYPYDIDLILRPTPEFGPEFFKAVSPFFAKGLDAIQREFNIHLHFWALGFPRGMTDFRNFFQRFSPQDQAPNSLKDTMKKGIVCLQLSEFPTNRLPS